MPNLVLTLFSVAGKRVQALGKSERETWEALAGQEAPMVDSQQAESLRS